MNNKYIYFIIIPVCILILLFACSGKQDDSAVIKFKTEIYNFGTVNEGDVVEYTFVFKNNGKENILITGVRPTCGCTVAGEYDKEVKPGESGNIPINLKTNGYQGEMSKVVRVSTNVPGKEEIVLTLRGKVYTPITVAPKMLWLGQVQKSELSLSGFFTITNNAKTPLKITDIIPSDDKTIVTMKTIKANQIYQIDILVKPPFQEGKVNENVVIKTDNPDRETLTVQYSYNVQSEVFVYPQTLTIEPGPIQNALEKVIRIESYNTQPISVINLQFVGKTVNYNIEELAPEKTYVIKLLFPAGFELKEKEIMVLTFQIKKGRDITVYNIPIHSEAVNK
ncbi:MAG: DUF1573 domain-containing protein [Spirochaetales bacterium]|nr:DUF1573 domain-containing protein [Spirochaetales bacterium]